MMTDTKKVSSFLKKTLVLIPSKEEFDMITKEIEQQSPAQTKQSEESHDQHQFRNQEIVVPRIGLVPPQQQLKKIPKLSKPIQTYGYFRLRQYETLPNPQKYELTKSDMEFIRILKNKYNFNKKYKLNSKTFIDIIETCEHNFHKHKTIKLSQDSEKYLQYLNFTMPLKTASFSLKEKEMIKQMILQIVDYWKKQKIQRGAFPLLRMYWPKTDLAMGKYSFWVPYKLRVFEEAKKKQGTLTTMRNFGITEKEKNLNRQVTDVTNFYMEVKEIADTQKSQHQRFQKEVSMFHKFAEKYDFQPPEYLQDIIEKKTPKTYTKLLQNLQKSTYFRNPIVKLTVKSRFHYKPTLSQNCQVSYNPVNKQLYMRQFYSKNEDYEAEMYLDESICGSQGSEQNQMQMRPKIRKRPAKNFSFYNEKRYRGNKKVKIEG